MTKQHINDDFENIVFKKYTIDNGLTGVLIAEYADKYETTAGESYTLKESQECATYLADYAVFLPVFWFSRQWLFPDGSIARVYVDYNNKEKPYVNVDNNQHYSMIKEIKEDEQE